MVSRGALMNGVSHHRRTSFAVVFAALFVAIAFTAVRADSTIWKSVLGWIAAGTLLLSIAYFINWPGVLENRKSVHSDGLSLC